MAGRSGHTLVIMETKEGLCGQGGEGGGACRKGPRLALKVLPKHRLGRDP